MRIGIFADIHSNLEALEAVLADMDAMGVEQKLCIGDIVGYGANPSECLDRVRALDCPVVMGNHDEAAIWELYAEYFNPDAKLAIQYSKSHLNADQRGFLASLPLVKNFDTFAMVHAEFVNPGGWKYLFSPEDAQPSLEKQKYNVSFFGHTHIPHAFVDDGHSVREYFYSKLIINPEKKYFLNVGSVGQPRDGDWRGGYVIYDTEQNSVELRRVVYDLATAQAKIIAAGLPKWHADRLGPPRTRAG